MKSDDIQKAFEGLAPEILLSPGVGLVPDGAGLAIKYHPRLGDDCTVGQRLAAAGIVAKAAAPATSPDGVAWIYDVVLKRRPLRSAAPDAVPLTIEREPGVVVPVSKAAAEKRIIWYVCAEPMAADTYGERITVDEVEDAAHRYMLGPRRVYIEHGEERGLNERGQFPPDVTGKAFAVESYLAPCELATFFGEDLERPIPMGSWLVAIHYADQQLWNVLSTTRHGISWRGFASKGSGG